MRRTHYAIGAAVLTVGAAAMVLLPKFQKEPGQIGVAYLPSGMQAPFSAPPTVELPVAEVDMPVVEAPKAPETVAEIPTSAPVEAPVVVARADTGTPLPEIPVASAPPISEPFVWHGSGGNGQSWKGTGGRVAALNNGPSAPSGGFGGGGGGGGSGVGNPQNPPTGPSAGNNPAPVQTASSGGGAGRGPGLAGLPHAGGQGQGSAITDPGDGLLHDAGHYASYQKPTGGDTPPNGNPPGGDEQGLTTPPGGSEQVIAVDEPGPLSLLVVGILGLFLARRVAKRTIA